MIDGTNTFAGTDVVVVAPPPGIPRQLLVDYLERCRRNLAELKEAVASRDFKHTGVVGHRLKGSGSAYGANRLTELGALIETASARQALEELGPLVEGLQDFLGRVEVAGV